MIAVAVIVAAGKGERFGDAGKVMTPLGNRPAIAWTLDAFEQSALVTDVIVVAGEHTQTPISELVDHGQWTKVTLVVPGGASRQASMANGVNAAREDADVVLVHDAARPLVTAAQIDATIVAANESGAAILAAPVTDTIKQCQNGVVVKTVDRSALWQAQTPQAFAAPILRNIATLALSGTMEMTDEASLAEHLGHSVSIVESDSSNLKLTHVQDVIIAEAILQSRKESRS